MLLSEKSIVPRSAVDTTIRRGIEMFEKFNPGQMSDAVRIKITNEVIRLANLMNAEGAIKNETRDSSILYRKA